MSNKLRVIIRRSTEDGPAYLSSCGSICDDWQSATLFKLGSKLPHGRPIVLSNRQLKRHGSVRFANRSRRQELRRSELFRRFEQTIDWNSPEAYD